MNARNYSNINENKPSGKKEYEVSGVTPYGAFHMLGKYSSTSERGAKIQAKKTHGDDYKTYQASCR